MKSLDNKFAENIQKEIVTTKDYNRTKSSLQQVYRSQKTSNEYPSYLWSDWYSQIRTRINSVEQLSSYVNLTVEEHRGAIYTKFKFAVTPYLVSLIDKNNPNCPIRKQFIPTIDEIRSLPEELEDPSNERAQTVVPKVIHRYPDRVVLIVTDQCAAYCRFCSRKWFVAEHEQVITQGEFAVALNYIKEHKEIHEVLISGGDPLTLSDEKLEFILSRLKEINIEILRIETRIPVVLPQRVTPKLCSILKKYSPLYIHIQFNHPKEINEYTKIACEMLVDSGIPLSSQTVLLKGINDKPHIIKELVHKLLKMRVRADCLLQCNTVIGTSHFRTPISCGIKIIEYLRRFTTDLAVPNFVIELPNGGGKVPVSSEYIISKTRNSLIIKNYEGKVFVYPEVK